MTYKEKDIVYEDGDYAVIKVPKGYEVLRAGITHSEVRGYIGRFPLPRALESAKWMIKRDRKRQGEKEVSSKPLRTVTKQNRREVIAALRQEGHEIAESASAKEVREFLRGFQ